LDDIMSETVEYYLMLFRMLPFMNSRCWRRLSQLSDPHIIQDFLGEEYPNVLASILDVSAFFESFSAADLQSSR
jgi:hypothetical protein